MYSIVVTLIPPYKRRNKKLEKTEKNTKKTNTSERQQIGYLSLHDTNTETHIALCLAVI